MHQRVWVKLNGQKLSVSAAARFIGVSATCLWYRLQRGVSKEELLKPGYGPRGTKLSPVKAALNGNISAEEYLASEGTPLKDGQRPIGTKRAEEPPRPT